MPRLIESPSSLRLRLWFVNPRLPLRRYPASGRPDEERGAWKIDVIDAE